MTDAAVAPVEEPSATAATATAETTAASAEPSTASATDAASKERPAEADQTGSKETDDVPELTALSKEERQKYSAALKALPPDERKTLNRLFDEKAKAAAAAKKVGEESAAKLQKLSGIAEIIQKIETDPDASIAQLQAHFGKTKPKTTTVPPEFLAAVEEQLDPESKPLAKAIAPVMLAIMEKQLQPVESFVQQQKDAAALAQAQTALEGFGKDNPDWKEYEPKMLELGAKFPQPAGVSQREYLDYLYTLASHEPKLKAASKANAEKVLEKVARAASNAEPDTTAVSPARVAKKAPGSIAEAWAMAQRGETVAD